jgi:hypothetical protein
MDREMSIRQPAKGRPGETQCFFFGVTGFA